jgi:hypothetical protein
MELGEEDTLNRRTEPMYAFTAMVFEESLKEGSASNVASMLIPLLKSDVTTGAGAPVLRPMRRGRYGVAGASMGSKNRRRRMRRAGVCPFSLPVPKSYQSAPMEML